MSDKAPEFRLRSLGELMREMGIRRLRIAGDEVEMELFAPSFASMTDAKDAPELVRPRSEAQEEGRKSPLDEGPDPAPVRVVEVDGKKMALIDPYLFGPPE